MNDKSIIGFNLSLVRIMQLSRGLDPHNSLQNSDSKLNANRICETPIYLLLFKSQIKGAKKKWVRKEPFFIIFNLSEWGCVFLNEIHVKKERRVFDHKNNNSQNQIT